MILTILDAKYGNETKTIDVSNILNKMILENQLYISKKINLNWLFTDPCPNHKKSLKIKFSYGNIDYNSEFKENRSKLNESVFIFDPRFKHYPVKNLSFNDSMFINFLIKKKRLVIFYFLVILIYTIVSKI